MAILVLQALDGGSVLVLCGAEAGSDVEKTGGLGGVERPGQKVGFERDLGPREVDRRNEEIPPSHVRLLSAVEPGGGAFYLLPVGEAVGV